MTDLLDRVAGAPITWGVDGSPGWGHLMDPDRVLAEMVEVGLRATELGPDGYLGAGTDEVLRRLEGHGLALVGGFIPVILYREDGIDDQLAYFDRAAATLHAGGARVAVLGPDSHYPGYDQVLELAEDEWDRFFVNLDRLCDIAVARDMLVALHQHWGMAVQSQSDMDRVIDRSTVGLCVDTGHLALAGVDTVDVVRRAAHRVHHVHLKDVDVEAAERVRSGAVPFRQAVIEGMFLPLGEGGAGIADVVLELEQRGFDGWYVLEQDVALERDPAPGAGPIEDAARSMEFLRTLAPEVRRRQEETVG
jgi:inosose dehydratase